MVHIKQTYINIYFFSIFYVLLVVLDSPVLYPYTNLLVYLIPIRLI